MKFEDYTDDQLRAILSFVMRNCDRLPMSSMVEGTSGKEYHYLLFPDVDPKTALVLASFKGRNPVIRTAGGNAWLSKSEKDFVRNLELKLDKWKAELLITNVRFRSGWNRELCLVLCRQLYASAPTDLERLLSGLDVDKAIELEKKQKEQAKKYAVKKRAVSFSVTEQETIANHILRMIEKEYVGLLLGSIFKNPEKVTANIRYTLPRDNYFYRLLVKWHSPNTIDPSGQLLYDSLAEVFNMDREDILAKLIGKGPDVRRFAVKFSDKFNVSGLVDSDPEVRLLAKQKVSKK